MKDTKETWSALGGLGFIALLLKAFSMGGGTYTGIEAVSNGLQILREPRVKTGKRTMLYMAVSLSITAGGLLLCYLLANVRRLEGQTLNAVLVNKLAPEAFGPGAAAAGFALITLISEGALLFVAAQAGFLDGPRVLANMAIDSWVPAPVQPAVRAPRDAERHPRDGPVGDRDAPLHGRLGGRDRRHVLDQRLPHVHALPARDVRPLVAGAAHGAVVGAGGSRSTASASS